jgi:hypothetical protein
MINQVFEFKDLSVEYEAGVAQAKANFYSALPGAAVAQQGGDLVLPITTTRQTRTFPLGYTGAIYKARFTPGATGTMKVYGAVMQVRQIGVYLDGSMGEFWETQETALGI